MGISRQTRGHVEFLSSVINLQVQNKPLVNNTIIAENSVERIGLLSPFTQWVGAVAKYFVRYST